MDGYQPKQSRVMKQIKKSNLVGLVGLILVGKVARWDGPDKSET
jgi:hypothetical protein